MTDHLIRSIFLEHVLYPCAVRNIRTVGQV